MGEWQDATTVVVTVTMMVDGNDDGDNDKGEDR